MDVYGNFRSSVTMCQKGDYYLTINIKFVYLFLPLTACKQQNQLNIAVIVTGVLVLVIALALFAMVIALDWKNHCCTWQEIGAIAGMYYLMGDAHCFYIIEHVSRQWLDLLCNRVSYWVNNITKPHFYISFIHLMP